MKDSTNLTGVKGLSLGAGIKFLNWQLDYAMTTIGDFGTSNQIALSLHFGDGHKPQRPAPSGETETSPQDLCRIPLMLESSNPINSWQSVEVDDAAGSMGVGTGRIRAIRPLI